MFAVLLAAGSLISGCSPAANTANTAGNTTTNTTANKTAVNETTSTVPETTTKTTVPEKPVETKSESSNDPKSAIVHQFDLIKAGDFENLKTNLTPRVREGLTKDIVDKAKADSSKYTIEDLYDSVEMGDADGKKTAKVKMKNGRTLTTLVETDGKWLADTIWFKSN